ncbi:diguanylate cyclase [Ruminococcaceae bacterium OttesenSCG-928-A11]|nr:diguanylate cyclase [Ruminococcaceae bacterium OttesenSCG-928-A11]
MALFGKKKGEISEEVLAGILDAQNADMLVVRGNECRLLFMNAPARSRMRGVAAVFDGQSCRDGYCKHMPGMCAACPLSEDADPPEHLAMFTTEDAEGRAFSVSVNAVEWTDGRTATALYLQDISEQKKLQDRLYSLAYIDHLTQIPNRQKLKDDFEAIAEAVESGGRTGLLTIFDMDNFKAINDTYGHNTGDVMLRRLVDHLQSDPGFNGHLYRLGGDEFVFLFKDKPGRFSSGEARRRHYEELLSGAFLSYSMPNIELSCTISMGAAFFPEHGANLSELLRKADIALYQAKGAGRNQLVFFEDQYDTAKKFKDLYINIQPILTQHGRTFGYELVDRGNENTGEDSLNLAEFDRTLDALGLGDMASDAKYFIHYTNQLMSKTVLTGLPKDKFVVQITLSDQPVSPEQLKKYQDLHRAGYQLALTGVQNGNATPHLLDLATYIKFEGGMAGTDAQKQLMAAHPDKWFVATSVDTNGAFEAATAQGFKLFQGFFFNQPAVVKKTKDIDPMRVNYLRLLKLTSTEDYVNFAEIATIISSDVALSYKLLRLLNSAAVGLRNQISSIDMALAYLGEENLKQWIALLALRGVASDKPLELVRLSLIRAHFGQLLCKQMTPKRDARHVFLLGLFSLLHIALEKTQAELFDEIPVADEIKQSLLGGDGPYSDIAEFFSHYEYANWDEVTLFARANGLTDRAVSDAYIAAVKWYNDLAAD